MKEVMNLITSDEAIYLIGKAKDIQQSIDEKSYSLEEEEYYKEKQKVILKRIKEIMKEGE